MTHADEVREQQRATWDRFSEGWTKWDEVVLKMIAPVGAEMIDELAFREDGEHLEIAAGTGEPGLTIAALVPRGHVTLTDLSAGMLATASARSAGLGLANVRVIECGVDDLPFEDASFDTIGCRFGLMFFPDIAAAVTNLVRVLRPGGRISAAVWAEPPGNPWATITLAAIGAEVNLPLPAPDSPSLFRCAAPGSISEIFRSAGLSDVQEVEVHGSLELTSGEEYWSFMTECIAPVVAGLALASDEARSRIHDATLELVEGYASNGAPSLPLHARCISGTK